MKVAYATHESPLFHIKLAAEGAARSKLKLTIEDTLDSGLPRAYGPDRYRQKCAAVFEHVYESYRERNAGVYA